MNIMDEDDREQIKTYFELAKLLQPVAEEAAEVAIGYGPAIYSVLEKIVLGSCALRVEAINFYLKNGFTKEESITLACNTMDSMNAAAKNLNNKKGN